MDFEVVFPVTCAATATTGIIILKKYLINLNQIIKNILITLCVQNLGSSVLSIIFLTIGEKEILKSIKCDALQVFTMSNIHVTIINLALISYTKFYLAWKTFKLEAISICYIVSLTVFGYVYGYLLAIYKIKFVLTPFGSSCIGNKDQDKINKDIIGLNVVAALTIITIGFVYDISLYFFLKHRNQIEGGLGKKNSFMNVMLILITLHYEFQVKRKSFHGNHPIRKSTSTPFRLVLQR